MIITERDKLAAIEQKYYFNVQWIPKLHDYYTLTRHNMGLELFQIGHETDDEFGISCVWSEEQGHQEQDYEMIKKEDFIKGFMDSRIHIPHHIIAIRKADEDNKKS